MILALALLIACGSAAPEATASVPAVPAPAPTQPVQGEDELSVQALHQRLGSQVDLVLDVRTPAEFAQGHVAGAVNIPLQELKARQAELEPYKDKQIAVICAVGGRSATATSYLRTEGYAQAYNVLGGTRAWVEAGYPTE